VLGEAGGEVVGDDVGVEFGDGPGGGGEVAVGFCGVGSEEVAAVGEARAVGAVEKDQVVGVVCLDSCRLNVSGRSYC